MVFKRKLPRFPRALLLLLVTAIALTAVACTSAPSRGWTGPLVSDNYVYVGTVQGNILAYDINAEGKDWVESVAKRGTTGFGCSGGVSAASGIYGTPVLRKDKLYIGSYDGSVLWIAVDGTSVTRSKFETGGKIVGSVAIDGDTLYVGSSNGNLYALDLNAPDLGSSLKDGWPFETDGDIWCTPVVQDKVVYIGSADHYLYAIDSESGNEIWRFETEAAIMSTPLVANGRVYIGGCDRNFYSVQAATEDERVAVAAGDASTVRVAEAVFEEAGNWFWTQALAYNGQIWVGCLDGNVYVLDAEDLGYIDEVPTKGMVYAPPVSLGGMVIAGSQDGSIYIIDPGTRDFEAYAIDSKTYEPVKAPEKPKSNPAPILAPMFADEASGTLYFHAQDGYHVLYAFKLSTTEILWHFRTDKIK
jgi:outer membrane protein assembly factor BamB